MHIVQFDAGGGSEMRHFRNQRAAAVRVHIGANAVGDAHFANPGKLLQALEKLPECRPNRNCRRKPPGTEAFNSRGVPRAITRPWSMMARRWQSVSASSMLCVVSRMVLPVWLYSRT